MKEKRMQYKETAKTLGTVYIYQYLYKQVEFA